MARELDLCVVYDTIKGQRNIYDSQGQILALSFWSKSSKPFKSFALCSEGALQAQHQDAVCCDLRTRVWGSRFVFRVWGFGIRDSGFGFGDSDFGYWNLGFGFRVSDFS